MPFVKKESFHMLIQKQLCSDFKKWIKNHDNSKFPTPEERKKRKELDEKYSQSITKDININDLDELIEKYSKIKEYEKDYLFLLRQRRFYSNQITLYKNMKGATYSYKDIVDSYRACIFFFNKLLNKKRLKEKPVL